MALLVDWSSGNGATAEGLLVSPSIPPLLPPTAAVSDRENVFASCCGHGGYSHLVHHCDACHPVMMRSQNENHAL